MTDVSIVAGAGGGCFRRGTQVQLEHGKTIAIEDIKAGDRVLAFDEAGELHVATVEKLHIHEDPQPILHVRFWRGQVFITPNHWVLNQYSSFVEIQTLSIDDALVDGMGHLRPIISAELIGRESVYNLTVEKYHTFIANGIRVHNGGHRETYPVVAGAGMGGGKGGGGRAAREDAETLQSKTMVSLLDLLGEGQIGGLLSGAQSIYFNGTQLQNSDGSFNAPGVTWEARYGTPNQTYIPGYSDIETPFNIATQCKFSAPVTFTVTNLNADRCRIIVTIPSLTSTDITTGDLHGTSVEYKFQISTNGGPYYDTVADYTEGTATIGTDGGYMSVVADDPSSSYVGCVIRLDATGTVNYTDFTWGATAVVQPQIWTGSAWLDNGPTVKIQASPNASGWSSRFSDIFSTQTRQVIKDAYVDAPAYKARFVIKSVTPGATLSLINPKAYSGSSTIKISGKTRSRYQRSHLIALPKPATTWNIRMVRITPDAATSAITNDTYLDAYVEIVDTKMSYTNSAIVGVKIDSSLFNKIPDRAYLVDGLYIRVPSNYDPLARTYSGIWNGTFKVAVSNNPAWILFDLLTNARYGLGQYIGESGERVDKAALYSIGKYCDTFISDGFGGLEPRFTINTAIQSQAEAYKLITDIVSVFQGMCYWSGGLVGFSQDAPADPGMIYSSANVVDGLFTYSGSARKDRHSVIHVTWNDPLENYKQKIEYVEDPTLVAKYGIRKSDVVAFGCTSRGQANRVGRWILYTEQFQSSLVSFSVGIDSALVLPGEVVRINDTVRAGKRMAGRVQAISSTSATLDAPVTFGASAEISFALPDGTFVDRAILQGAGTYSAITWTTPLATLPLINSMFIVAETALKPYLARVLSIAQDDTDKSRFTITAVEYNPLKYDAIENGWTLSKPITSIIKARPDAPTSLVLTDILYRSGANYASKLHASWDNNNIGDIVGWHVRLLGPSNIWQDFEVIKVASIEFPNVTDGQSYTIEVRAINVLGFRSDAATVSRTVLGKDRAPSNVTGAIAIEHENGVKISWVNISDIDLAFYEIREGTVWETATEIGTVNNNFIELGPQPAGIHTWLIRAKDTTDHYSELDATVTLSIGLPATPTVIAEFVGNTIEIGWSVSPTADSYYVEITNGGIVRRSFTTTITYYSYTFESAKADGGPWRSISVSVKAKKGNVMSLAGTTDSDVNETPAAPSLILVAGIKSTSVTVSKSDELDYAGTFIHGSTVSGFTPSDDNKLYEGNANFFLHTDITQKWYYKAAHYDNFGKSGLTYSAQFDSTPVVTVAGITIVDSLPASPDDVEGQLAIFLDVVDEDLRGLYGWSGTNWVNASTLADGSITYEKFDPSIVFNVEIEAGEIVAEHIADGAIAYEKLDPDLAFEIQVEAGEITSTHIADDAISTPKLKAGAVIASKIAADQITANHLQADSVTTLKIAADQILGNHIVANQIQAGHIAANQITASHILAGSIVSEHLAATKLSAIKADMGDITAGNITLDVAGFIRGGQTDYDTGTGFWLGYKSGAYKFSLGGPNNYVLWDGSNLSLRGNISLGANNYIQGGQTTYNTGTGFFFGYEGGKYKLSIGNPAGKALFWDGTNLTVQGDIITTGNINNNAVTQVGSAYTLAPITGGSLQYLAVNKTTNGGLLVNLSCFIKPGNDGFSASSEVAVFVNGAQIYRETMIPPSTQAKSLCFYFPYVDTSGPGAKTYELKAMSGSNCQYSARSIVATELKR